ncbi:MAG: SDR family NAD(P)-dependent oxidoreductase [Lautropia sp.]
MPSFALDGRRALVTGAGRGIGLACATALAHAGADVVLAARSADEIGAAAAALRDAGLRAQACTLDVTDAAGVARFFAAQAPFEVLVNNAGTNRAKPVVENTDDDLDAVIDLNLKAAWRVSREWVRALQAAGRGGSLINVSSQMGHVGGPNRSLYCASKHGLEGMTKALAWELGPRGIRVNTLCPTFVLTDMTRPMFADEAFRRFVLDRIALGRLGELADVMGPVVFLASDASAMITGSALMVDGGWTAT